MSWRRRLLGTAACSLVLVTAAHAADPVPPTPPAVRLGQGDGVVLDEIDVVAKRLDPARSQIQPSLGATKYDFGRNALETIPQGDNAPLNQVVLRAPGVAQDSFGQFHLRNDHANVQYRLDGVQLPEGLSVFELVGPSLLSQFANTTAAPANTQNSTVKADRSHYFDVGISQVILPGLTVTVDA